VSDAAAARLRPVWKDAYAAMVIDLARFFRPVRPNEAAERADDGLGEEDPQTGLAPRAGRESSIAGPTRTPESMIRRRLIRLSRSTDEEGLRRRSEEVAEVVVDAPFKGRMASRVREKRRDGPSGSRGSLSSPTPSCLDSLVAEPSGGEQTRLGASTHWGSPAGSVASSPNRRSFSYRLLRAIPRRRAAACTRFFSARMTRSMW
jgi:hypothetical protein